MNPLKQYKKLQTLNVKAERCLTREEAQEVIKKADKARNKLNYHSWINTQKKTG
jgi:hypothetical protein